MREKEKHRTSKPKPHNLYKFDPIRKAWKMIKKEWKRIKFV